MASNIHDHLSCSMCLEVYDHTNKAPKGLPCQHIFCMECLEKYLQKNIATKLPCPLCQAQFTVPRGGVQAIPTNVVVKGMLDFLPDSSVGQQMEEMTLENPRLVTKSVCKDHPGRECIMVCMACKVGLCDRCLKGVTTGPHAQHELEGFDDAMTVFEKLMKMEAVRFDGLKQKTNNIPHSAYDNLEQWRTRIEKSIEARAKEAMAKINKWKDDMHRKVCFLYDEGRKQVKLFIDSYSNMAEISATTDILTKLGTRPCLENLHQLDPLKKSLDEMESLLKIYSSADMAPKEILSQKWTCELGDVQSIGMLSHLQPGKMFLILICIVI